MVLNSPTVRKRCAKARHQVSIASWQQDPWGKNETHLEDGGALKHDEHKQCEETVVPVLVEAPQSCTKHLKDEEWRDGVFGEQLEERGDGDVKDVLAIVATGRVDLFGRLESSRVLDGREEWRAVARVRDATERARVGRVEVLVALVREEDERSGSRTLLKEGDTMVSLGVLAARTQQTTHLRALQRYDLALATVQVRNDLDHFRCIEVGDLCGRANELAPSFVRAAA